MGIKIKMGHKSLTIRTQICLIKRLINYPSVVFITFLLPSIHRILLCNKINSMTLNVFHKISVHSGGILLFVIFVSSKHVRTINMFYINWVLNKLRGIYMRPEEKNEKTLENALSFDSDGENERTSTSSRDIGSQTTSVMIDWLNTSKNKATSSTAITALGEMGLNDIELSKRTQLEDNRNSNSSSYVIDA